MRMPRWRSRGFAALSALLLGTATLAGLASPLAADPAGPALERAVESGLLDAEVVERVQAEGSARILAFFAQPAGSPAGVAPDAARTRLAETGGFVPGPRFDEIPVLVGRVDASALAALVADPWVWRISLDQRATAQLAEAVPLVGLDLLRAGGFDGSGAKVAIVDTGVDDVHPDIASSVVDEYCYCDDGLVGPFGCCPGGLDEEGGAGSAQDDNGHGTRVASVIVSDGVYADLGGAPNAGLVAVKVLGSSGGGYVSDILLGMKWVRLNHPDTVVLNMSLGFGLYAGDCDAADADTMAFAAEIALLRAAGILFVAGSGNDRSGTSMIVPACVADAISVGAVWDADVGSRSAYGCTDATTAPDQVACWSNSSPTTDLLAPGGLIKSSILGGFAGNDQGTSLSTPMVTACAAILAHEYPAATLGDLESALESTGFVVVDAKNGLSYPRVDCVAAFQTLPEPGAVLSLGCGSACLACLERLRRRRSRRAASAR